MVKKLERMKQPEIFIGIVAPIGTNIDDSLSVLSRKLRGFDYKVDSIKITDSFPELKEKLKIDLPLSDTPLEKRYEDYIAFGDAVRERFDDDAFLAEMAIDLIQLHRTDIAGPSSQNLEGLAYILNQFKRKEEVDLLRSVYGKLFFQISIYSKRSSRVDNLARKIARSYGVADPNRFREDAERLVRTDENEITDDHGQRVSDVFHQADFIIDADSGRESINKQVGRFVDLIFGSNVISPTKEEYGLYMATSASLRSLDLSRQVGAAVFSKEGEIISLGANEVPKGGGGTYWCDDPHDDRDYKRQIDSNQRRKEEILSELLELFREQLPEALKSVSIDGKGTQFMDALEYGRIIHAEMSAITDAARLGRPLKGATLYCTTFPCHMCAKHIVAAGVDSVVFLEPYPKSLAGELHSDSIDIEGQTRGLHEGLPATAFRHFHGVSPRRYRDLFERQRRKKKNGQLSPWRDGDPQCIVDLKRPIYLALESFIRDNVLKESLGKAGVALADLHAERRAKHVKVEPGE